MTTATRPTPIIAKGTKIGIEGSLIFVHPSTYLDVIIEYRFEYTTYQVDECGGSNQNV
jgi:hypothetical protein